MITSVPCPLCGYGETSDSEEPEELDPVEIDTIPSGLSTEVAEGIRKEVFSYDLTTVMLKLDEIKKANVASYSPAIVAQFEYTKEVLLQRLDELQQEKADVVAFNY